MSDSQSISDMVTTPKVLLVATWWQDILHSGQQVKDYTPYKGGTVPIFDTGAWDKRIATEILYEEFLKAAPDYDPMGIVGVPSKSPFMNAFYKISGATRGRTRTTGPVAREKKTMTYMALFEELEVHRSIFEKGYGHYVRKDLLTPSS